MSALVFFALVSTSTGCSKDEDVTSGEVDMPPPVSEAERARAVEACTAYVARVCACAQDRAEDDEIHELCELAPGKLSSLNMVLRVNNSPENADERVKTSATARRIMASCISEQSKLDSLGCKRRTSP